MKPIIFNTEMVRAILDGIKTQTRRTVKHIPHPDCPYWDAKTLRAVKQPYQVGDVMYARETCIISPKRFDGARSNSYNVTDPDGDGRICQYIATTPDKDAARDYGLKTTPSIHMPKWAARIFLSVKAVRLERVKNISEADAIAEGIAKTPWSAMCDRPYFKNYADPKRMGDFKYGLLAKESFLSLYQSIYGNVQENPWVWVIEFERVEKPEGI